MSSRKRKRDSITQKPKDEEVIEEVEVHVAHKAKVMGKTEKNDDNAYVAQDAKIKEETDAKNKLNDDHAVLESQKIKENEKSLAKDKINNDGKSIEDLEIKKENEFFKKSFG